MPVATTPPRKPEDKPNLVISKKEFVSQVVDTTKVDYDTLSTFIQGQKWIVDYYSQNLGRDSAATSFQPGLPAIWGQYRMIRGFELVVSDSQPMNTRQNNDDTGQLESTSSAIVYSCVSPQNGDMFIADIGNGRNAIFQVNVPALMGHYPEANTTIEYSLIQQVDNAFLDRLFKERVTKTLYFSKENFKNGLKALLTEDDINITNRLAKARGRLIYTYFKEFFDDVKETFVLPFQESLTYDPNLTRFMRSILATEDHPQVSHVTLHGVGSDVFSNQITLFDAIAKRDPNLLYSASRHMGISPIAVFRNRPLFASIAYSGIKQVITAVDPAFSVNNHDKVSTVIGPIVKAGVRQGDMRSILPQLGLNGSEPRPDDGNYIKRVVVDDYYVLSKDYYDDGPNKSMLEQMLLDRTDGKPINLNDLADLADYAMKFDNLERFYYVPLILVLIKLAPGVF